MSDSSNAKSTVRSSLVLRLPAPSVVTRPFWEGCAEGEFRLQVCTACDHVTFYPRAVCPHCLGSEAEWLRAAGHGTIVSYTKVHRGPGPDWQSLCPYVIVIVKLAEGPTVTSRLVDWEETDLRAGRQVEVVFLETGTELGIPVFRPQPATEA